MSFFLKKTKNIRFVFVHAHTYIICTPHPIYMLTPACFAGPWLEQL